MRQSSTGHHDSDGSPQYHRDWLSRDKRRLTNLSPWIAPDSAET